MTSSASSVARRANRRSVACLLLALVAGLSSCRSPLGTDTAGAERVRAELEASALTGTQASAATRQLLAMRGLTAAWDADPDGTLETLQSLAVLERDRNLFFTLAELHYIRARDTGDRRHDVVAAMCAYWFLLSKEMPTPADPFDRRYRQACDLYNRCLLRALKGAGNTIDLESGLASIPDGLLDVHFDRSAFPFDASLIDTFIAADELEVRGFDVRNRDFGLGLPLIGHGANTDPTSPIQRYLPPRLNVPATAFLRLDDEPQAWIRGARLHATLELYSAFELPSVDLTGRRIPLETDVTASLAYALEGAPVWDFELTGFMGGESAVKTGLFMLQPYVPGKIPVVLVHGTASSPARWAPMFNELLADPVLRSRCQFMFFTYNTGNPIALSGKLLRDALNDLRPNLDPAGRDPALTQMVVIGHSQGGLLTRMMVTNAGDVVWNSISPQTPIAGYELTPEARKMVELALFWHRVPDVNRAIFVATPQRGSFMTTGWIGSISRMFISLPQKLGNSLNDMLSQNREKLPPQLRDRLPTAIDNMKPDNPFLMGLASAPIDPAVHYHSIIAVNDPGPPEGQNDGVVEYESAHLEHAESEFVVQSGHSCQANPLVIREVRRILLEQIAAFDASQGTRAAASPASSSP